MIEQINYSNLGNPHRFPSARQEDNIQNTSFAFPQHLIIDDIIFFQIDATKPELSCYKSNFCDRTLKRRFNHAHIVPSVLLDMNFKH